MRNLRAFTTGCVAATVLGLTAATSAQAAPDDTNYHEVGDTLTNVPVTTEEELTDYVLSSEDKTITQDVKTGEFTKVTAGAPTPEALASIIVNNPCQSRNLCLWPSQTPYANYGFSGSGTKTGTWTNRAYWVTGKWTGKTDTNVGPWSAYVGPNTTVYYSQVVTTTGVQIR